MKNRSTKSWVKKFGKIFLLKYGRGVGELDKNFFIEELPGYLEKGEWFAVKTKDEWIRYEMDQVVKRINKLVIYEDRFKSLQYQEDDIDLRLKIFCIRKEDRSVFEIPDVFMIYNRRTCALKISVTDIVEREEIGGIFYFRKDRIWSYIKSATLITNHVESDTLSRVKVKYVKKEVIKGRGLKSLLFFVLKFDTSQISSKPYI